MKVSIDLTENKGGKDGISVFIKNLLDDATVHEYYGGAFAGINSNSQYVCDNLSKFYNVKNVRVKKIIVPEKLLPPLKFFNFTFPYKKIFDDDTNICVFFNEFMPRNKLKTKKIAVIHDLTPLYLKSTNKLKRKMYLRSYKYTIKNADKIITVSEFSKKDIIEKFPQVKGKVEVVYNGVNCDRFQEKITEAKIEKIKAKYNLPKQYILFVGQARENKNLVRLLNAYAMLPAETKKQYGIVYANTNAELDILARKLNESNVRLLRGIETEDLVGVYQGAALFTLVSTNEGFGIPVIEAMAAGVPVVCSNISSLPEVVGDAAVVVDPYSESEISQAILRVLSDENLQKTMIDKGFERIKQFSWKKSAEKFEKILSDVLEDK